LAATSDEQYESIPDDEITLLVRKFWVLHKFRKERRSHRGCFECGDTTHFTVDCPKRKKLDSSNKYNYNNNNRNNFSNKGNDKKKYCFRDQKKKKKFQKIMFWARAVFSDFNFSNNDSSSSEEGEEVKRKQGNFTGICLMGKSSRNISDSDVSGDLFLESLSLWVTELENAICIQDKLLCKVFRENKKLNLEFESAFSKIASLRLLHDDMSAKPCDNYNMIIVNYVNLWLVHTQVVSQLKCAKLELRELKSHSLLLGACTSCHLLRYDLVTAVIEIKDLKHILDHASRYTILTPLRELCGSLKGKLFYATKENTELKKEVAYLTTHLERTVVSEKMIEDDLSRLEESATKSTYKLVVGFERCEDECEKRAPKFVLTSNFHKEEETIKSTKPHYPSSPKPSFNPKRDVKKETPKPREEAFVCMFCGRVDHLDKFYFCRKRNQKRRFEYARIHIVMSSLIFCLAISLVLRLALLLMLCLISLMYLIITHMVLVHVRTTLCLGALIMAHVLIVVIVSHVGLVFLLEGLTLTLSLDTWMVHIFPVVVLIPLGQVVNC
jgi:hypothetical protein